MAAVRGSSELSVGDWVLLPPVSALLVPGASTPPVLTSNMARQHCVVGLNALTRHLQPRAIQARERAQVWEIKGSMRHVEVFRMDGVGISIIGRPRPLSGHDTPNPAHNTYTPNYEEPGKCARMIGRAWLRNCSHMTGSLR